MGCDIHVMVEARQYPFGPDKWFNVDNWRYDPCPNNPDDKSKPALIIKPIYNQRDYELFSFLAGVRNYGMNPSFGFDRGFPEDACEHTAAEYARWGEDAHTPGYATLAELKECIGKVVSKVNRKGFVHKSAAAKFKATGETPTSWCQGVGGVGGFGAAQYEWMEWQDEVDCFDFDLLLAALEERKREVFWHLPDKDDSSEDANIRIVFWFDN